METDWKIAVAAIVGLSVIASAFIFSGGDALSGFALFQPKGDKEVAVYASLDLDQFSMDIQGTSNTYMKFNDNSVMIQIGKERFDPLEKNLTISMEDFNGKLSYYNGVLFAGNAREVSVGSLLKTREKSAVSIGSQSFDVVRVSNVSMNSFTNLASGTVDVGYGKTKTTVRLSRESLTIGGFRGSIELSNGKLIIEGTAEKVVSANKINIG